jgi:hypothetical protein
MTYILHMLLVLGGIAQAELAPQDLVAKLGSSQFAEYTEAALSLRHLGAEALPALRAARRSKDPPTRRRATMLIDAFERNQLTRPTRIRLDFRDRSLAEVVTAVREQSGFPLVLEPRGDQAWNTRRITLQAAEPVAFWEALERLGRAGGVRHNPGLPFEPTRRTPRLPIVSSDDLPIPTSCAGPYRVCLIGLSRDREVTPSRTSAKSKVREQFTALIQMFAEPGLVIDRHGPPQVIEALDDRGRDLRCASRDDPVKWMPHGRRFDHGDLGILSYQVPLELPDDSARSLERLRGSLPITVKARTENELVIALADSPGRTFSGNGVTLSVSKIEPTEQGTAIHLSFQQDEQPDDAPLQAALDKNGPGPPLPFLIQDHVQLRDALGRICWCNATQSQTDPSARTELILTVSSGGDVGPPTELRYFGVVGAATEVSFTFRDVPLP